MSLFSEKITKDIQEKKITPSPKWHFLLKNYGILSAFIISIICGSVATSVILFMFFDYDRDVYQYLHRPFFTDFILSIPYLWIIILFVFIAIAHYGFEKTYTGYRYEIYKIISISLVLSIIIGTGLFYAGLGSDIDDLLSRHVPFYENLIYNKDDIWIFPQKGLLSGQIIGFSGPNSFVLRDFKGKIWQILENNLSKYDYSLIRKGISLRLLGHQVNADSFEAESLRLWLK